MGRLRKRKLWPAGALVAAAVLTACGHPAATTHVQPAAERAPVTAESAAPDARHTRDANRPLPNAAAPATTTPAAPSAAPTRTASPPPAPPPPRTSPPRPPVRTAKPTARAKAPAQPTGPVYPPGTMVLHIGKWERPVVRGDQAAIDRCTAAVLFTGPAPALADGAAMSTSVIVGHDFCGYSVLAPLRVGTHVTLDTARGTLSYHVYANYIEPGQGGPDNGLYWGDLTLQTCVGPDTGFSYLTRD